MINTPLIRRAVPMQDFTTIRAGGSADYFCVPLEQKGLEGALEFCRTLGLPFFVAGRGSNLLVRDSGFGGMIIAIRQPFFAPRFDGVSVTASAGERLATLARMAGKLGLAGLEWARGIPGTLGGAIAMNAGAFGGQMSDVVSEVFGIGIDGECLTLSASECGFDYRASKLLHYKTIITSARLTLQRGDTAVIESLAAEYAARRAATQPLGLPSAGSVYKKCGEDSAGALIDRCGLKGLSIGGATVSRRHANFFVNTGGATASDFEELMTTVEQAVFIQTGAVLEREIRVI